MIVTTAIANPIAHGLEHFLHRRNLAANFDPHTFGRRARRGDGIIDLIEPLVPDLRLRRLRSGLGIAAWCCDRIGLAYFLC